MTHHDKERSERSQNTSDMKEEPKSNTEQPEMEKKDGEKVHAGGSSGGQRDE